MQVAQLARKLNVSVDTVRYYTLIGLITPSRNPDNNYKEYHEQDRRRLQFILSARNLGFTLNDIKEIIREASRGKVVCHLVREILEKRLEETERNFHEQYALRKRMKKAMKDWKSRPDKAPTGHEICHLIEGGAL